MSMENKNKETKNKIPDTYRKRVVEYLKTNPLKSKILLTMDLQKRVKRTPENNSEWPNIGYRVVFCLPNGTVNAIYIERNSDIERELVLFEKLWWRKILKNPELLDKNPELYQCPKCGKDLCFQNFDGTYKCGRCNYNGDKPTTPLPKTKEEEKAYEQAKTNVIKALDDFPVLRAMITLPDGTPICVPVGKDQKIEEEIQKMKDRWWNLYENKNPKLIKNRKLVPCPECGGELIIKKSRRGGLFCACSNYPTCRFIKGLK